MPSTNDFLSKPLIALTEGKNCGIVTNMLFDPQLKTVTGVLVFDQIESTYNRLDADKIKKMQNDAVVIDTADDVTPYDGNTFNPINFDVFDVNGKYLGLVTEIILNKDFTVKTIECRDVHITPERIYSHSQGTLIIKAAQPKRQTTRQKRPKPATPTFEEPTETAQTEQAATTQTEQAQTVVEPQTEQTPAAIPTLQEQPAPTETPSQQTPSPDNPQIIGVTKTVTGTGSFLIGRRCDKNILNRFNEIIIRQGAPITNETIRKAKLSGKLLELSMHAK